MRLSPNRHHRLRITQVSLFLIAMVLTCLGIAGLATQAKAGPVALKFDNAQLNLGLLTKFPILPATPQFPSPDLPAPQRTDITLNGTETNGQLSFPALLNPGTQFPYMHINHPIEKDLKVPFTFRLKEPGLTGTYDAASGNATLNGKMDIIIVTGQGKSFPIPDSLSDAAVPPLGLFARCRIPDVPVTLSTETKSPLTGEPFTGGFGVKGAMTAAWDNLPQIVSENGGDCSLAGPVSQGAGGLWLSNGIVTPKPQPPTCREDSSLCPSIPYSEITAAKLAPKKKTVKAGKKTKLKVTLTNGGDEVATGVEVTVRSSNKKVKVPKKLTLDVPAGSKAKKAIKIKVKRSAKGRAKITVKAGDKKAKAVIKIRAMK